MLTTHAVVKTTKKDVLMCYQKDVLNHRAVICTKIHILCRK